MDRYVVATTATMDQCTQTPYPGSELFDPNPFVTSPIKPKDTPGVGEKRALSSVSVSHLLQPCHIVARPATELRPTIASRSDVPGRVSRIRSGRSAPARCSRSRAKGSTCLTAPSYTSAAEQHWVQRLSLLHLHVISSP